ncbi:Uncharacterised protein [uncultured archaeon]|nr:Uncharacterised protein [uncultured archaeon]
MVVHAGHGKIAEMAGIPSIISDDINRFMEDRNPPEEFEDHNTQRKIFVCGHLNVSIRTLMGSEKLQDGEKRNGSKKKTLNGCWQRRKNISNATIFILLSIIFTRIRVG